MLGSVSEHLPEMFGNTHSTIQEISKSIRRLALLVPPDNLYKEVSDDRLYELVIA